MKRKKETCITCGCPVKIAGKPGSYYYELDKDELLRLINSGESGIEATDSQVNDQNDDILKIQRKKEKGKS